MTASIRKIASTMLLGLPAVALLAQSPAVKLPPYKKVTLKNGMVLMLMEQHKVPLVNLACIVRASSVADPAGKEGLASITASLLRKGTRTRSAEQVSESLDSVGAEYYASAGYDYTAANAEFMKKDIGAGLDLFADLLMSPVFPEAEVKKLAAQRVDGVKAAKDSAQGVIRNYFQGFLFGSHPYGRPAGGDERSLAAITREDVVKFHAATYLPSNVILAIAGDFKLADMEKLATQRFGSWTSTTKPLRVELPTPKPADGRHLLLVDKPDATQTYFMIGNVGIARANPDRVPIEVVNVLFGGRFTSMLNSALRIKSGLTYGANAFFDQRRVAGPFAISSYTANATTEKALDMALEVLDQLHKKGITETDLLSAKAYIKGTLPPQMLETGDQLATLLTQLQFYGLPDAEVDGFYAKVDAMTLADAQRVIRTYYPSDALTFVLIGKAKEIEASARKIDPGMKIRAISEPGF